MKKVLIPLLALFIFLLPIYSASALVGLPYGGFAVGSVVSVPCTCAGPTLGSRWQTFFPIYYGNPVPLVGALVVPPAISYQYYQILPLTWSLGFYTPGAGITCGIQTSLVCIPLLNSGIIIPFRTGASLPLP